MTLFKQLHSKKKKRCNCGRLEERRKEIIPFGKPFASRKGDKSSGVGPLKRGGRRRGKEKLYYTTHREGGEKEGKVRWVRIISHEQKERGEGDHLNYFK